MSIRIKIMLGCLCLTALTIFLGLFAQSSQIEIGQLATRLYNNSLLSTNSLRSAQSTVVKLNAEAEAMPAGEDGEVLPAAAAERIGTAISAAEADLSLASSGSISQVGRQLADQTRRRLARLMLSSGQLSPRFLKRELVTASDEIEATARVFAADAYDVKGNVDDIVQASLIKTRGAIAAAGVLMLLVVWGLSRTILPTLRRAAAVAKSISEGDFTTRIDPSGRGEGADLLEAMAIMQSNLAERFDQFESTVAHQADVLRVERSTQNVRLDAAIETMMQGLCMFDARSRVSVVNRRFIELFPTAGIKVGATRAQLGRMPEVGEILSRVAELPSFVHRTGTGQSLSVSLRKTADGGSALSVSDVTDDRLTAERIDHAASHDGMTGLFNRFALTRRLQSILDESAPDRETALLVLDIDGFRGVNEAYGHPIGDALLKSVSERLSSLALEGDLVARIGGDDFAFVRTDFETVQDAEELAESIVAIFGRPFDIHGHSLVIGVSIGIAAARDGQETIATAESMLLRAEFAQGAAQASGRNRHRYFEPAMEADAQQRRQMELDLGDALEKGEFEVFYQPIVDVPMHTVSGFEALIRWRHPERGMISPAQFIPVAEESGLITPIGLWILETACRHAADWPTGLTVAVNLSPIQFKSESLFDDVQAILARTGFAAYRLQLEVTEGVFLNNSEQVLGTLTALRRIGIRISMDDFGTGYSSLGYLSRFPFDKVKIDQSFVRDLAKRENLMIVRAIVGLSKAMGLSVMAEGVETRRQMETLLAESCGEMQGYHFAMPMPLSDLPRFMMQFALDRGGGPLAKPNWPDGAAIPSAG